MSARPAEVRTMFTRIAGRYDLMNTLMTAGRHHAWRAAAARAAAAAPPGPLLDLATGTADLALAVRRASPGRPVIGADFSEGMLREGRRKLAGRGEAGVHLAAADALRLPFADGVFVAVVSAFLLRNLADLGAGLAEMGRVTRRGGLVVALDIVEPTAPVWRGLFNAAFQHVIPVLGAAVAGDRRAYTYLPESVTRFVTAAELVARMRAAGLRDVGCRRLGLGTIALATGVV